MTLPLPSNSEHSCAPMQTLILFHLVIYIHFVPSKLHCTLNSFSESLDHTLTSLNHTVRFREIETGLYLSVIQVSFFLLCQSDRGGSETGGLGVTSKSRRRGSLRVRINQFSIASSEPYKMSDSSSARQRARSSIFYGLRVTISYQISQ